MKRILDIIRSGNNNILLPIVLIIAVVIVTLICRASMWNAISFIATQFMFLYLPGRMATTILGLDSTNNMLRDFLSYAIGYALSITIYILLLVLGLQSTVLYIYIVVFLLSIWYFYKLRNHNQLSRALYDWFEKKWFTLILSVSMIIGIILYVCVNLSASLYPNEMNVTIDQDLMFWLRNSIAATFSYPLPDLSVLGNNFFYHYFSSIEMAFLHLTTGIDHYNLCFGYSILITLFLLASGLFVLGTKYTSSNKNTLWFVAFILLTCSFEVLTDIYFTSHFYVGSFGLAEGLAFFCFTLYIYKEYEVKEFKDVRLLISFLILFFVLSGLKAPLALLLLFGIGINCLYRIVCKNSRASILVVPFVACILFGVVFFLFVSGNAFENTIQHGSNMDMYPSLTSTMLHSKYYSALYHKLASTSLPYIITYPISLVIYIVLALFIPLSLLTITIIQNKKKIPFWNNLDIVSVSFLGLLLCLFVGHKGMSQMYFVFPTILLTTLFAFSIINLSKCRKVIYFIFLIGVLLLGIQKGPYVIKGIRNLAITSSIIGPKDYGSNTARSLNPKEIDGLVWVRNNLPQDAVIISNKLFASAETDKVKLDSIMLEPFTMERYVGLSNDLLSIYSSRSTIVSCFTERQTYMEGYYFSNMDVPEIQRRAILINRFYNANMASAKELQTFGVTHAAIFKSITPSSYPQNCRVLFENEKILIVEL